MNTEEVYSAAVTLFEMPILMFNTDFTAQYLVNTFKFDLKLVN